MKTCLECADRIVGREDKKYCSDACRNAFNNRVNRDASNYMRNVNNTLRRNYRILSEINPDRKARTTRAKLAAKGFNFEFCTGVKTSRTGRTQYHLYDQAYQMLDDGSLQIVKKDH